MSKIAVVMGNGKSLLDMPAHPHDTFGTNYIKLAGIQPTYYVCVDSRILLSDAEEIYETAKNAKIAFLSDRHGNENENTKKLYALPNVQLVHKDKKEFAESVTMTGGTATYVALKMAFYLGYDTVYLYGVDHNVEWDHFSDSYPREAPRALGARMNNMLAHYKLANDVYKKHGRRIINFSKPSELDKIFDRPMALDQNQNWIIVNN